MAAVVLGGEDVEVAVAVDIGCSGSSAQIPAGALTELDVDQLNRLSVVAAISAIVVPIRGSVSSAEARIRA